MLLAENERVIEDKNPLRKGKKSLYLFEN